MASQKRDRKIRISKDKHFITLACVPLEALSFPYSRDLDTENVERLRNELRSDRCFSEREEHHTKFIKVSFASSLYFHNNCHKARRQLVFLYCKRLISLHFARLCEKPCTLSKIAPYN